MKKTFTLTAAGLLTLSLCTQYADASTYALKNKYVNMPDLSSSKVVKSLAAGTYKYYKVGLKMKQEDMEYEWGVQKKYSFKSNNSGTFRSYIYGYDNQVVATTKANGTNSASAPIYSISIKDNNGLYTAADVKSILGQPDASSIIAPGKKTLRFDNMKIAIKKKGIDWLIYKVVVTDLGYTTAPEKTSSTPSTIYTPPAKPAVYYKNCTDVWNKLGRSIYSTDPGYSGDLDNDGDGEGCESRPR